MSRFETGWVKLYRDDFFGPIGQRGKDTFWLWSKLLCMASRYESEVRDSQGIRKIPPGTVVCSLRELADEKDEGAFSKVRRDLKFLESIGKIEQSTSLVGRLIFIKHWASDQVGDYEKEAENTQKMRQGIDTEGQKNRTEFDKPQANLTSGNLIPFSEEKSEPTNERQSDPNFSTAIRTHNGEREEEYNTYNQQREKKETKEIREITETKKISRRKKNYSSYPEEFEEIYREYPRKEGKTPGFRVYLKEILSLDDLKKLKAAVSNYRQAKCGTEVKYLLHFSTFMNQWRDWLELSQAPAAISIPEKTVADFFGRSV